MMFDSIDYLVRVKEGYEWKNHNTCRFQVSVGSPKQEGEKLKSSFEWMDKKFERIIVCVNDTLQRFNYIIKDDLSEDKAYKLSMEAGDIWQQKACEIISGIQGCAEKVEFVRWDYWKNHKDFNTNIRLISNLYDRNGDYAQTVDKQLEIFWDRKKEDLPGVEKETFFFWSQRYLLEECAVFPIMFSQDKAVDIYPGTYLLPLTKFKEDNLEKAPKNYTEFDFTRIDFVRKKIPANTQVFPKYKFG